MIWAPLDANNLIKIAERSDQRVRFRAGDAPERAAGAFRLHGLRHRRRGDAARQPRGFLKFQLRPRRLVDVSKVDMSTDILGTRYSSPIICAPTGGHRAYHPDGELGVARAAKAGDHLMILSTQTSTDVEDVTKARGAPIWMQLYATNKFEVAADHVKRAENAGCTGLAVTVDRSGGRNQETLFRLQRTDFRDCQACHDNSSLAASAGRQADVSTASTSRACATSSPPR